MADVRLTHLAKAYDTGPRVIGDVSIDVHDKEFVVLVGPSGCGKSTLLRMIAGLETITAGDLLLDGRRINDLPPKDRDIAMVFQNYALYPHMTVYDNMAFGLKLRNMPKAEIHQRVTEAARMLEITALLDRKPKDMSGGQRQRVAIGRAIVRNPKVFLFDEPLSNLDAKLRGQTRIELQKLHRQLNATIIYVTHDQVEAMTLGDRIVVLRDGAVQQFDTPLALYNHPVNQFVAGFMGTPPMNFLPGRLIHQDNELCFRSRQGSVRISLDQSIHRATWQPHEGRDVVLGIRADFISNKPPSPQRPVYEMDHLIQLDAVESMGSETLVYFGVEGVRFVGRLPGDAPVRLGQKIPVLWAIDSIHFFDSVTQQNLSMNHGMLMK